ncbi:MAG: SufE family protein [Patescibacteria group bacterium]
MTKQDQIIADFSKLASWDERYEKIIELGQSLPKQTSAFKVPENKVSGCQSRVWLSAQLHEGRVVLSAESDAMIVRGLLSLILQVYSGLTPKQIIETKPYFIDWLGLSDHLSSTRSNGIKAVLKKIKFYAIGFEYLLNKQSQEIC